MSKIIFFVVLAFVSLVARSEHPVEKNGRVLLYGNFSGVFLSDLLWILRVSRGFIEYRYRRYELSF